MRAVNLIPTDSRTRGSGGSRLPFGPSHAVIAVMAVAVLLVTVYVLTGNTIADRKVKLAALQQQVTQERAEAARLSNYARFVKLADARIETVRQIAATRFDWHAALSDLSRVVPADTSLQALNATVAPGDSAGGGATPGAISVRTDVTAPAFELRGCTLTQDDVARLLSRLRLINGVQRVTLEDAAKPGANTSAGPSVASGPNTGAQGCGSNTPTFDIVVFFTPLPGEEAAAGATPPPTTSSGASSSTTTSSSTSTTTTAASTTTTSSASTTPGGSS